MKLSFSQQDFIQKNSLVVLSTIKDGNIPWSILVEVNKVEEEKLIITDNQMHTTQDNIKKNSQVCVLVLAHDHYSYLKIHGKASYYHDGEYFTYVKNLPGNIGYSPKGAVIIDIEHIQEIV